ncbi:hypothetical protein [Sphingobacterium tabacisoli]|uniref:Uncharacterized protein n=1 Tax=Sphingobacterium tabacisoli TaxID=2044855 RepID=A0ABW5KYJ8_9SPHI|nr:hypothetical protein [Sphingobacterium tabacisoli]
MAKKKGKEQSSLATYLLKNFEGDLRELHLFTGIPYNKLTKGVNNQLHLDLRDFLLIALAVRPDSLNSMATEVFSNFQIPLEESNSDNLSIANKNVDTIIDSLVDDNNSVFDNFMLLHMKSKQQLSKISGFGVNVISSLMLRESTITSKLIAVKFYKLCQALERNFEYWARKIYPDLELTTEEERKALGDNFYKNQPITENE